LVTVASAVWSQEFPDKPWSLPEQQAEFWVNPAQSCQINLILSLNGTADAESYYTDATSKLKTPLEKQMLAKVQHDICEWWQSSSRHTKQGLCDVVAESISVLPASVICRVRVTMKIVVPDTVKTETRCQVQPLGCTVFYRLKRYYFFSSASILASSSKIFFSRRKISLSSPITLVTSSSICSILRFKKPSMIKPKLNKIAGILTSA